MEAFIRESKILKESRMASCKCRKYPCKACKKLNQRLCRGYHNKDPHMELILRIQYEFVFNYISEQQMIWECMYGIPIIGMRDRGHEKRMKRLFTYVRNISS